MEPTFVSESAARYTNKIINSRPRKHECNEKQKVPVEKWKLIPAFQPVFKNTGLHFYSFLNVNAFKSKKKFDLLIHVPRESAIYWPINTTHFKKQLIWASENLKAGISIEVLFMRAS